jgi:peptidoglycan/LPS O-acetylase OafA/YrhL
MKRIVPIHLILLTVGALTLWVYSSTGDTVSFALGGVFTLANLGVLGFAWKLVLEKKSIALAIGVIVLKYAILFLVVFGVITSTYLSGLWFGAGFALIGLSSAIWSLLKSRSS